MNNQERDELTEQSNALRGELKCWEKEFAAANQGRKASRDDIKKNPDIATKYKEYNKSRDILSGKIPQPPKGPRRESPRKRKHEDGPGHGLSKRQQIAKTPSKTPSKGPLQPWEVDPYDSPSVVRSLFTPSKKSLGPTPQKDGVVLGLFDLLQEDKSPSNFRKNADAVPIQATPPKPKSEGSETLKHARTPASVGKRLMQDAFATPLKNRGLNGQGIKTPSSVSKLHFSTPSFLRRDSQRIHLPTVNENEDTLQLSPQMLQVPRKPLVRGLSSMLASLRKLEEEAYDDDMEALHDMEVDMAGLSKPASKLAPQPKPTAPPEPPPLESILVPDSHLNFPLGGFDDEAMYDCLPEDATQCLGRDGQPLKVYKKKGQKRTTRRVNMKPTRSKPTPQPQANPDSESEDEVAGPDSKLPEIQVDDTVEFSDARNFDSDQEQSEYTASEGGTRYRRPNQARKSKSVNKDRRVKTAARKVGALAHQNFKRLKLRSSGARGGPAHNSRFRRKK